MKVENNSNGTASSANSQQQVIRESLQLLVRQLQAGHSDGICRIKGNRVESKQVPMITSSSTDEPPTL